MIKIQNKSDTLIIVIHEIYGINQHMKSFCEIISEDFFDVICPNLLKREKPFDYSQEEVAYRNFMENIGFAEASNKIRDILSEAKNNYKNIFIIGFSIGATVSWLCSEEECVDGIVGYYGSRIRNYEEISPRCPTMLFFPQEEPSFNVDELISILGKKNIEVHKYSGQHGFSDPYSPKYNFESTERAFIEMVNFLNVNKSKVLLK